MFPAPPRFARRLLSVGADEFFGTLLLHTVLRHRGRPPECGPTGPGVSADLLRSGDPRAVFAPAFDPAPDRVPDFAAALRPAAHRDGRPVAAPPGVSRVEDFALPSPVVTRWPASDLIRGRVWRSGAAGSRFDSAGPRPTVLFVDGLVQPSFKVAGRFAGVFAAGGADTVSVDLPFNHRRTPPGWRPGQLILGGDLVHVFAAGRQAVLDVLTVLDALRRDAAQLNGAANGTTAGVGLCGISFGGWAVLTAATVDAQRLGGRAGVRFAAGLAPAAHPAATLREGGTIMRAARRNVGPLPDAADDPAVVPFTPARRPAPLPPDRVLLHVARWDRFVPNARIRELAAAWGTGVTEHETGHMGLSADARCNVALAGLVLREGWGSPLDPAPRERRPVVHPARVHPARPLVSAQAGDGVRLSTRKSSLHPAGLRPAGAPRQGALRVNGSDAPRLRPCGIAVTPAAWSDPSARCSRSPPRRS